MEKNREGFLNITEIRNFLHGFNNTKHSKVYVRIEQINGYNNLCIYCDNNYTKDEVTSATDLEQLNGFKKRFQKQVNKVESNDFLMETVQDITTVVWDMVKDDPDGTDSRVVFSLCRSWADEFEKYWISLVEQGVEDDHDYMLEVEEFAEKKANEYLERK